MRKMEASRKVTEKEYKRGRGGVEDIIEKMEGEGRELDT